MDLSAKINRANHNIEVALKSDGQDVATVFVAIREVVDESRISDVVKGQLRSEINRVESLVKNGNAQEFNATKAHLYDLYGLLDGFFGILMLADLQPGITVEDVMAHPAILNLLMEFRADRGFDKTNLKDTVGFDRGVGGVSVGPMHVVSFDDAKAIVAEGVAQANRTGSERDIMAMIERKYDQPQVISGTDVSWQAAEIGIRIYLSIMQNDINVKNLAARAAKDAMNAANSAALHEVLVAG
jgi:hypothetical protein